MHRVRIPQAFLQARPLPASSNRLDSDSVTIWMGKNTAKSTGPKLGSPRCCTTPPEAASLLKAAYHRPWGCSQQPPYVSKSPPAFLSTRLTIAPPDFLPGSQSCIKSPSPIPSNTAAVFGFTCTNWSPKGKRWQELVLHGKVWKWRKLTPALFFHPSE